MAWGMPGSDPNQPTGAPDPGKGSAYPAPKRQPNPYGWNLPQMTANMGSAAFGAAKPQQPKSPYGSESGPGILENWFNQRANGTDPGFEYAAKRSGDALDTRMAAGGSFNSGARAQSLSDMYANLVSQREGQLDSLAAGASGEHQGRINSMFNQGLGLAGGESSINSAYDLAAGKAMSDALSAGLGFTLNKGGVDNASQQQGIGNLIKIGGIAAAA